MYELKTKINEFNLILRGYRILSQKDNNFKICKTKSYNHQIKSTKTPFAQKKPTKITTKKKSKTQRIKLNYLSASDQIESILLVLKHRKRAL